MRPSISHTKTMALLLSYCFTRSITLIALLFSFSTSTSWAQYPTDVEYRKRGNRYEGVKSRPVSGHYIELISALVMPQENTDALPGIIKLRFNIKRLSPVFITVRERDPHHNYWLDEVTPKRPWRPGFGNEFSWPSNDVLKRLAPQPKFGELAVLVRLGKRAPSLSEEIAPAVLYGSQVPNSVSGYNFTFRMGVDARLVCSIYRENENTPSYAQTFPRLPSGRPFTFVWNSSGSPEGWYKLRVTGKRLSNNEDVDLTVSFYHQPLIKS